MFSLKIYFGKKSGYCLTETSPGGTVTTIKEGDYNDLPNGFRALATEIDRQIVHSQPLNWNIVQIYVPVEGEKYSFERVTNSIQWN